jgi:WD40 repeat protein/serine/threonine protein kinase/DNA-binding winged helix-turn-helix (wHTH) protein
VQFRLLGPLEVVDGRPIRLGGPQQRTVLAHLLLRSNQLVPADRLIDEIWGDEPPKAARSTLHGYVSLLRKALGQDRLEGRSRGYVLHAEASEVDVLQFEALVEEARRTLPADPAAAVGALDEALGLWRGPALGDLAGQLSLQPEIARLEELRMAATEERIAAELGLGRHTELVPELETLTSRHPLRERLWGHLMLALYRSGRQGDALAAYRRAREILAEELGIDPSRELQRLQEQVLNQDPVLDLVGEPLRGYRLLEPIGEGVFGAVHRAFQPQFGREVAVKVIHPRLANDPEFIRRFEAEAQLVARLEYPHIVPLYDYWRDPDGAYLVMRYLRSGSLRSALATGSLGPDRAAAVIDQVALALTAAHREGVVHGDVKPANILFDEEGNAYLSDFGIAKDFAAAEDLVLPAGSPDSLAYYLSPEEARGDPPTVRADVYSLGLVLYEMLAGQHPFADAPPEAVVEQHLAQPVPSVLTARPDLPAAVDEVIERATAKEPDSRYPDARVLAAALREALGPAQVRPVPVPAPEVRNPYKGLRPFLEADAPDFFGRDALVERLLARMGETGDGSRLLAVVGPSGSGKSSLVRAGLIPALRTGALPGSERWFVVEMLPSSNPFAELETALLRVAADPPPPSILEELEKHESGPLRAADWVLPDDDSEMLLVIDQFEELFTLLENDVQRARFLESLATAVTDPRSRVRVLLTLRADFYDRPLAHRRFGDLLARRTLAIAPPSSEELERAISGPAERAGVTVEPRLEAEIIAEVSDRPGALPLFQYGLTELFEHREDGALTLDAYRAIGGVSGALARRAEELYGELDDAGKGTVRQLFLRLVTLGEEGSEDTRRRVRRTELTSLQVDGEAMDRVIDAFGAHRLLSFDRDPVTRGPTVEVAHEALLTRWARLRGWIEATREDVRMHRRLAPAAAEWAGADRDPSFLLRGSRLVQFEAWAAASGLVLTDVERDYLTASVDGREAERRDEEERQAREALLERRSVRRLRALVAALTVATVIAAALTSVAVSQRQRAEGEARVATAQRLAAAADASLREDPELSILLALEAVETTRSADGTVLREAKEALHRAVHASRVVLRLEGPSTGAVAFSPDGARVATGGSFQAIEYSNTEALVWDAQTGEKLLTLKWHLDTVNDIEFSPDGSRLVTTSQDRSAKVWDARTGQRLLDLRHADGVMSGSFSPDGKTLATASLDGTMHLWDANTGTELVTIRDPSPLCGSDFSPDGTLVAAGTCFGGSNAKVWDASTGERVLSLKGHRLDVTDVAFSPDGHRLATVSNDGTARIWDARTGRVLVTLRGHGGWVMGVDFSPDGSRLATSSIDGTARVWEAAGGRELLVFSGHAALVGDVAFSPDGNRLLTGSDDGTARVWDVTAEGGREWLTVAGQAGPVSSVEFSPRGERLLTTGLLDGTTTLWDASTGRPVRTYSVEGGAGARHDAAFSPDGTSIVSVGDTLALWETASDEVIWTWDAREPILSVTYSPDGTRIAVGLASGSVVGLDPVSGAISWERSTSLGFEQFGPVRPAVHDVAVSPDGGRLATASWVGTAKVFYFYASTGSLALSLSLVGHRSRVQSVDFSPDGRFLATSSWDGTARVWNASSGEEVMILTGHVGPVNDAVYSPDGKLLATAGEDNTARLWNQSTGREVLRLSGHSSGLTQVAFSPDGTRLATSSEDGTVRVYLLRLGELMDLARKRVTRGFTDEECRVHLQLSRCPTR